MKNIVILREQLKDVRNYAAFVTYDGLKLRLDWSISLAALEDDSEDLEAHVERLMFQWACSELDDTENLERIRAKGVNPGPYDLEWFLQRGMEEIPGTEFKRLAVEKFGDS